MQEIIINRSDINIEALDAELRSALSTTVQGISTRSGQIIVHLSDRVTAAQMAEARRIVTDHDASIQTMEQQKQATRQQQLVQFRSQNQTAIDTNAYSQLDVLIRALAEKIAWLEQEINDLHEL